MDLEKYNDSDLLKSLLAESAKSMNELKQAQGDLDKINSRLRFILVILNTLQERGRLDD
jgi:hypothetical protein